MAISLTQEMIDRLKAQQVIWFSSVRPDGRPHLAPVWFVWLEGRLYIGTDPKSIKAANIQHNPRVTLALEDGTHPVICEGTARSVDRPWPEEVLATFFKKYEWDMNKEEQYNHIIEVTPARWLGW